jgi:hypothetical protein
MSLDSIFEFSKKEKEKRTKQKIVGHTAAAAGMLAMPAAFPFLKIKGRDLVRGAKGLTAGLKERMKKAPAGESKIAKRSRVDDASTKAGRETTEDKGKFIADYMSGAEKAGSNVVTKPWMDRKIANADKFSSDHYKKFREGKKTAHDHWNWENSKRRQDQAWEKGVHAGKMRDVANKNQNNPDLQQRAKKAETKQRLAEKSRDTFEDGRKAFKDRMERISSKRDGGGYYDSIRKASASKDLTANEKKYISSLRVDKSEVGESYAKHAMIAPGMAAGGGTVAGHAYYKDSKNGRRKKRK